MADNPLLTVFLPLALGTIMIGLGLHLGIADFRRVLAMPKAVMLALVIQVLALPPVAFLLARAFDLPGELGLGMVLLAISPGGITANLFSHLTRGDIALNVSLTAINSLIALVTIPLWAAFGMQVFLGSEGVVPPPTRKVIEVAVFVIAPVIIGMSVRHWRPRWAAAAERPIRVMSTLILAALIVLTVASEWASFLKYAPIVGLACLAFNLVSLGSGYGAARFAQLPRPQAIAIGYEIGIHNSTLSMYIALQVLSMPEAAIASAIYSLIMYLTAALFAVWLIRTAPRVAMTPA
ncbi:bile acid:sodium symporter family protein [Dokdonella sp.]|uniref:bile acid:sodium symporter family protein n=1 Tax=Dokdonella sp. TaxID=2291710 RepID=UPI0035292C49